MGKPRGKKIDEVRLDVDGVAVKFDLRFVYPKTFLVQYDGKEYEDVTVDALKAKLREAVRTSVALVWTRYIVLSYCSTTAASTSRDRHYLDDRAPDVVKGVELEWDVRDFSNGHMPTGDLEECILERDVAADGSTGAPSVHDRTSGRGPHRKRASLPQYAIPYSPERVEVLRQLQTALTSVDRKLRAFFAGAVDEIAARLDLGLQAAGLPALPPPEPLPVEHRRNCAKRHRPCQPWCPAYELEAPTAENHDDDCPVVKEQRCTCGAEVDAEEDE
jgi:hypothetical protein